MTRFEEIGVDGITRSISASEAKSRYANSCNRCAEYNRHTECNMCAIRQAYKNIMNEFRLRNIAMVEGTRSTKVTITSTFRSIRMTGIRAYSNSI